MAIDIRLGVGNGKGKCGKCVKRIKKGEIQIIVEGWQTSSRIHLKCFEDEKHEFLNLHVLKTHIKNR